MMLRAELPVQTKRTRSAAGVIARSFPRAWLGATPVQCGRERTESERELVVADAIEDRPPFLSWFENAGTSKKRKMARDDGEVDRAALRNLADRASSGALGDAGEKNGASGIAERFKEGGVEEFVDRS
jgi:hypothetical protein